MESEMHMGIRPEAEDGWRERGESETSGGKEEQLVSRTRMLEEVDQLMDLVLEEKAALQEKTAALEAELAAASQRVKEEREESSTLTATLEKTRKELAEARAEVDSLATSLGREKEVRGQAQTRSAEFESALRSTRAELEKARAEIAGVVKRGKEPSPPQRKVREEPRTRGASEAKRQRTAAAAALQSQCVENVKLQRAISKLQEHSKSLQSEVVAQRSNTDLLQRNLRHARSEALALRGRLATAHKSIENLQEKCSAMKTPTPSMEAARAERRKQEKRLSSECKRKEELLAAFSEEVSSSSREQAHLEQENRILKEELSRQITAQKQMEVSLVEREGRCEHLRQRLEESERQTCQLATKEVDVAAVQQQLRRRLSSLEGELGAAVSELGGLRHALREKEERGVREERERERNRAMVAASQEAIDRLAAELDQTRRHHARLEEQTERHWRETVEEMRRDADRMKEAGTRRCAELAKALWDLKTRDNSTSPTTDIL